MNKRSVGLIVIIMLAAALIFTACGKGKLPGKAADESGDLNQPGGPDEHVITCPLTGVKLDEETNKARAIAVMFDNEYNARPQSGLSTAEIVYEMPVEGSITRYMGIYHHSQVEKIGPVRSARPYFIDRAMEFDAVYVHCGGSPQALKDLKDFKWDTLNDLKGSPCFWRSKDRKMPHNLYTSTKRMRDVMKSKNMEREPLASYFVFVDHPEMTEGQQTASLQIPYNKKYIIGYEYDEKDKIYNRKINDSLHMDKEDQTILKASNIIIEVVKTKVLDNKGRLEVKNLGTGKGYFVAGGQRIEINWEKKDRKSRTIYTDMNGNEIKLNRGTTWVQVVPEHIKISFKE